MQQSKTQHVTSRVLIALTLAVASFVGFSGIAEAATCLSCHATPGQTADIRPVDSAFRNITTGGFKGSHVKHIPAATLSANACSSCHAGSAAYLTSHRDGFINVTSATAPGLSYSKGAKFAQQGNQALALGTCSTASCHANPYGAGTVATPVWGAPAANCTACHTTQIDATGPATGSHALAAHGVNGCTACHAAGTSATSMPSANHNDTNINIVNVGYPATVAKHAAGSGYTSCSAASCHENPYGAGTVTTPVWGASAANCTACHTTPIDATGPATGSHVAHNDTTCADCHAAGTTSITKPGSGHLDGFITVTNNYPVTAKHAAGTYAGSCSTASCHANVYGTGTVVTPVWGDTTKGCSACHTIAITSIGPLTGAHAKHNDSTCTDCHNAGTTANSVPSTGHRDATITVTNGYPTTAKHAAGTYAVNATCSTASCHADVYSAGTVATPAWGTINNNCSACHTIAITNIGPLTGAHAKHNDSTCTDCHNAGTTATSVPSTGHRDDTITVNNGYPATAKHVAGTYAANATCSAASCHANVYGTGSATTPAWGTTNNNCSACHTIAITTTGPATGAHAIHNDTNCADCHTGATNSATIPSANHNNNTIDVANGYPVTAKHVAGTYAVNATCSAASCHANVYGSGTVATPAWGTSNNKCNACHTTQIGSTGPATGSHAVHNNTNCVDCHAAGTTATTPGAGHRDGTITVGDGYPATAPHAAGTYAANATCSTAVCHGTSSPKWGANTANDSCTKCHGTGTAAGSVNAANKYVLAPSDATALDNGHVSSNAKTGAHQTHLQYFNGLSQQGADAQARCEICHVLPSTTTHANGLATPVFTGIAAGGTYNAGTCSVKCHNPAGSILDAANAGTATAPLWTNANYIDNGPLKSDANCNTCHKSPGNPAFTAGVSHNATAMPLGIGTDCQGCHGHNGGLGGAAGQQHMDGIKWGNGSCDACHGYPPMSPAKFSARANGTYTNAKVEDYAGGGGYHDTHLLASVKATEGFTPCLPCHPSTFHNGGNGTVSKLMVNVNDASDTTFRFDQDRSKRYTVATQTCSNVSCHFQPTPAWGL